MIRRSLLSGVIAFIALFITSCQSGPEEIPPNLSRMEMFQQAQEASDQGDYEQALAYYEEFIRRYPDDAGSIVEAEYEIAFLAYKQDELPEARQQFEDILAKFESDDANNLPAWPRILSEKLIERIDERMEEEGLLGDTGPRGAGDPGPSADAAADDPDPSPAQ
ncbi:MAG TPA: tetratricopeptide repeat protein [Alkalispirochaeta sp.]|nr:tetratricopeptide repeat protein [Alkalispirochaeta sp.]